MRLANRNIWDVFRTRRLVPPPLFRVEFVRTSLRVRVNPNSNLLDPPEFLLQLRIAHLDERGATVRTGVRHLAPAQFIN